MSATDLAELLGDRSRQPSPPLDSHEVLDATVAAQRWLEGAPRAMLDVLRPLEDLEKRNQDREAELDRLRTTARSLRTDVVGRNGPAYERLESTDLSELSEDQLQELAAELLRMRRHTTLTKRSGELQREVDRARREVEELPDKLAAEAARLSRNVAELEARTSELDKTRRRSEQELASAQLDHRSVGEARTAAAGELRSLHAQVSSDLATLEGVKPQEAARRYALLNEAVDHIELSREIEALEADNGSLRQQAHDLEVQLWSVNHAREELEGQLEVVHRELNAASAETDVTRRRCEYLEDELHQLRDELEYLRDDHRFGSQDQPETPATPVANSQDAWPVTALELSAGVTRTLLDHGYRTVGALRRATDAELCELPTLGETRVRQIRAALAELEFRGG